MGVNEMENRKMTYFNEETMTSITLMEAENGYVAMVSVGNPDNFEIVDVNDFGEFKQMLHDIAASGWEICL